jgi:hypothetical protein
MLDYGVIRPQMGLPNYKNDLLARFSNWGVKKFNSTTDTVVGSLANQVFIQEDGNISYQQNKNTVFNNRKLVYMDKNTDQNQNWNFASPLPLKFRSASQY